MKLLKKINLSYFRITAAALLAGGILFFLSLRWIIRSEQDEKLEQSYRRIVAAMNTGKKPVSLLPLVDVAPWKGPSGAGLTYSDTMLLDPVEGEEEPFRQIVGLARLHGDPYRVTVRTSLVESEDLLFAIGVVILGLGLLLFTGLLGINIRLSRQLWRPFHRNLDALLGFTPAQPESLKFMESDIDEFQELNGALQQLTEKVRADYRNLREFTENASHEIQTPLAVIRSKIEWLAQSQNLDAGQFATVEEIDRAAARLSLLTRGLLLLSKIENRQFAGSGPVFLDHIIREQVAALQELTDLKEIRMLADLEDETTIELPPVLADVLVKNLLENAVRYSPAESTIYISLHNRTLTFANPGSQPLEDPGRLFGRFVRQGAHKQSLGLGLALVKQIAGSYGFQVWYSYEEGNHVFRVRF